MPKTREVIYEPHPVTPERKAELKKAGYRIVDIKFAPPGSASHPVESCDLRARAEALGIKIDKRWGEGRLRDEIAKAKG